MRHNPEETGRLNALIEAQERQGDLRLPPEPRLCEALGISRGRLRTLLKRAEDRGQIWRHVGKGTFIGARPTMREDAMQNLSVSVGDLFEARAVVEPQLAAQAALHATTQDVAAMETLLTEMEATGSFMEWKRLDAQLHRLIAQATHNALLLLLYDMLRSPMRWGLEARLEEVYGNPPGPRDAANAQHREIVATIAANNPVKAEVMLRDHIASVRELLFGRP